MKTIYHVVPALLCAAVFGSTHASAADSSANYPTRPVRLIVPFAPGGGTDLAARVRPHIRE